MYGVSTSSGASLAHHIEIMKYQHFDVSVRVRIKINQSEQLGSDHRVVF